CHDRNAVAPVVAVSSLIPPPADDSPTGEGIPKPFSTEPVSNPVDKPFGYAGESRVETPSPKAEPDINAVLRPDRWRIGFPEDQRYKKGRLIDPYDQNVYKGDYPIFGQHNFLVLNLESESFLNGRRIPLPSNVSSERPNSAEFFGRGGQFF